MTQHHPSPVKKAASETRRFGFAAELWEFMKATWKWWLLPIVVVIVVFSLLIFLSGTDVAPMVYTLF